MLTIPQNAGCCKLNAGKPVENSTLPTLKRPRLTLKGAMSKGTGSADYDLEYPIRSFRVEHEGKIRTLEIHRSSIGWIMEDKDNPAKVLIGMRHGSGRPIPVEGAQDDISEWWRAAFPKKTPAGKGGAK